LWELQRGGGSQGSSMPSPFPFGDFRQKDFGLWGEDCRLDWGAAFYHLIAMRQNIRSHKNSGFSLLELVIVLALIAALAGVVTMRSGNIIRKGQVSTIIQLSNTLKAAAASFYADTGTYGREYDHASYSGTNLELSGEQSINGWDGPYLEEGITAKDDNPFGALHFYDTPTGAGNSGFDLDADGTDDVTASANMLYLAGVTEEVAEILDDHYDLGVGGTWNETGRFNWNSGNSRAFILVFR
jgi:general secretion pathway protein G